MTKNQKIVLVCLPVIIVSVILINLVYSSEINGYDGGYYKDEVFRLPTDFPRSSLFQKSYFPSVSSVKVPILLYHYVEYVKDPGDTIRKKLDITPYNLERQLNNLINSGYVFCFEKELPDFINGNKKISGKKIVLTFDDGYEDFYTDAFPLLQKYQAKATIFIVGHFIGRSGYLKSGEIKEIIESGLVEVAAHTLDHTSLKNASLINLRKQIFESKENLENEFGIKVESFAYPYGFFNKDSIRIVKDAGYTSAASVVYGSIQTPANLFYLSRIRAGMLPADNISTILDKLNK